MSEGTCPLCGSAIEHQGGELELAQLSELEQMPLPEKLARLRDYLLLSGQPQVDGNTASALALVRMAYRMGATRPIARLLPPIEDEEGWVSLLALVIGVMAALPGPEHQVDYVAARQIGLGLLGEVMPE